MSHNISETASMKVNISSSEILTIYDDIYNNWEIVLIQVLSWILTQTIGNLVLLSLIQVEQNLSVRSILDHLISFGLKLNFAFVLFHSNYTLAKVTFGYLGETVCNFAVGVLASIEFLFNICFMEYCTIKIAYLFIKDIFSINEDFINHFLDIFNILLAIWYQLTMYALNFTFLDPRVSSNELQLDITITTAPNKILEDFSMLSNTPGRFTCSLPFGSASQL